MNVAFFYPSLNPNMGGVQRVASILSTEFNALGYSVYGIYWKDLSSDVCKWGYNDALWLDNIKREGDCINAISAFIKRYSISVIVNLNGLDLNLVRLLEGLSQKTRIITCYHNTPGKDYSERLLFLPLFLNKFLYRLSTIEKRYKVQKLVHISEKYVLLCKAYEKEFTERFSIKEHEKITSIYNPLTFSIDSNCSIADKKNEFLYVGRLYDNQKGLLRLLDAWDKASLSDWVLKIVGDGPDKQLIEKKIVSSQIKNVELCGYSQTPEEYYKKARFFVMASYYEGWPMSLIEAMQYCCIPIVMNSFSSLPEIISHKKNGFIIENGNIEKMSCCFKQLAGSLESFSDIAISAHESVLDYRNENIISEWRKIIEKNP